MQQLREVKSGACSHTAGCGEGTGKVGTRLHRGLHDQVGLADVCYLGPGTGEGLAEQGGPGAGGLVGS